MTKAQRILHNFYVAYASWVRQGARRTVFGAFDRECGLCGNLTRYCLSQGVFVRDRDATEQELKSQFVAAGLDTAHPFATSTVYWQRAIEGTHHECEVRNQWVQDQIRKAST